MIEEAFPIRSRKIDYSKNSIRAVGSLFEEEE